MKSISDNEFVSLLNKLEIENIGLQEELIKRLAGYFNTSPNKVRQSYFIFLEQFRKDEKLNKFNLEGIRNKEIIKHHKKILSLRKQGHTLDEILTICQKLNIDVKKSSVYKLIKLNEGDK